LDDVLARLFLVVGCYRILDVKKNDVGGGLCGLLKQGRVGPRHRQFGAVQTRCGGFDAGKAHW
jgi:hypothetical protein